MIDNEKLVDARISHPGCCGDGFRFVEHYSVVGVRVLACQCGATWNETVEAKELGAFYVR